MYFSIAVVLVYNKAPCHEGIWGSGDIAVQRLDFTIGIGEWSTSCPSWFSLREKASDTH